MAPAHIDKIYDQQLDRLTSSIGAMGDFAIAQFNDAIRALLTHDTALAQRMVEQDRMLDALRRDLSSSAALVIAKRQPMASDLEEVLADLRIVEDLERIGDLAKNIGRRTIAMSGDTLPPALVGRIEAMVELTTGQLRTALEAFVERDPQRAMNVNTRDDQVDETHHQIVAEMVAMMGESRSNVADFVHLLFCVKNIERIADHAVNVAKAAHLKSTGQPIA
jgi:phosphate transport system protein